MNLKYAHMAMISNRGQKGYKAVTLCNNYNPTAKKIKGFSVFPSLLTYGSAMCTKQPSKIAALFVYVFLADCRISLILNIWFVYFYIARKRIKCPYTAVCNDYKDD